MLTRHYPLLDQASRSIIMSVLWLEINRLKGEEYDIAALMTPLVQEWRDRILDQVEDPDPDWKATLDLVRQTAPEVAHKRPKASAARTEAPSERPKAPAARKETAHE